ncbi:Peptidase C48 SUMO/Sentrin/Ubl1 [Penicillium macrosclerotiorum]|uniref:Peptidase C48 SUMO/Sentrin/Ubl1 n=1 Tax=Penicillium macrosclerotiorum TaxID=303699 RepID=UPI0025476A5B|nr:Peptidase C48 SUMO/Sentrin/Ubl1 [Penicillium macrosclerotiorum]KAJ5689268.1 Peptidase C48 SUMO/Sentrin/Ubl1 [Penicillium macrosclerotiorum]
MDQIFSKHEHEMANYALSSKRSLPDDSIERVSPPESTVPITRKKLSSLLQDDTGNSRQNQLKQPQSLSHVMDVADTSKEIEDDSDKGIDIPVKKSYGIFERTTRQTTRRTARLSGQTKSDEVISQGKLKSLLQKDPFRKKWQKPLVYPRVGKKKAEVNVEDRDRLRDDEFLNDNLIGFYMRFLQDHLERTNSEAAKHVYFFNSYFFATLTNKGAREINYSGVEKWTRNVDLFSYKYIVVPINQNAHWYVAIICNLPSLPLESASRVESPAIRAGDEERSNPAENEVQEIVESPEPEPIPASPEHPKDNTAKKAEDQSESPKSQATRASLASLSLDDFTNASNEADKLEDPASASEDWPDGEETNTSTPAKLSPPVQAEPVASTTAAKQLARQPKKKARGGHRLDPSQPTIITFDSLDLGRSPTIKLLRDYICQEAASKRGVEVNPTNIKGMRARAIPLQPNYSDCGLYLLAYTEKFVQNPDQFIAKLLQKEMDEHDDWPPLGSGLLRLRLRDFLDRLYEEQAQTKSDKGLMADQQPVSFLLGPPPPVQAVEDQNTVEIPYPNSSKVDNKSVDKEVHEKDDGLLNEESAEPNDSSGDTPQLVPTDSGPVRPPKDEPSRKPLAALPKPTASPGDSEVVEVPDSQEAPMASTEPKPRSRGEQKKPSKETDARLASRKSGRVEVQIRATPPPGTPKPARKSPRWQARKS